MQANLPPWIIFSDFEKAEWASQMLGGCLNLSCTLKNASISHSAMSVCMTALSILSIRCDGTLPSVGNIWACNTAQLWPYLDSAVSDIGQQRLEQKLKERRARWMLDVAVEQ